MNYLKQNLCLLKTIFHVRGVESENKSILKQSTDPWKILNKINKINKSKVCVLPYFLTCYFTPNNRQWRNPSRSILWFDAFHTNQRLRVICKVVSCDPRHQKRETKVQCAGFKDENLRGSISEACTLVVRWRITNQSLNVYQEQISQRGPSCWVRRSGSVETAGVEEILMRPAGCSRLYLEVKALRSELTASPREGRWI